MSEFCHLFMTDADWFVGTIWVIGFLMIFVIGAVFISAPLRQK